MCAYLFRSGSSTDPLQSKAKLKLKLSLHNQLWLAVARARPPARA